MSNHHRSQNNLPKSYSSSKRRKPRLQLEKLEDRTAPAVFTVNVSADLPPLDETGDVSTAPGLQLSLRAALFLAEQNGPGRDTIEFSVPNVATTPGALSTLNIKGVDIDGGESGVVIEAGGDLIQVSGASVVKNLKFMLPVEASNATIENSTIGMNKEGTAADAGNGGITINRDVTLRNTKIANSANGGTAPAIEVLDGTNTVIKDNRLHFKHGTGIIIRKGGSDTAPLIVEENIIGNQAGSLRTGIVLNGTGRTHIDGNFIGMTDSGTPVPNGIGIQATNVADTASVLIENNVIVHSELIGLQITTPGGIVNGTTVRDNTFFGNAVGMSILVTRGGLTVQRNLFGPRAEDNPGNGVGVFIDHLSPTSFLGEDAFIFGGAGQNQGNTVAGNNNIGLQYRGQFTGNFMVFVHGNTITANGGNGVEVTNPVGLFIGGTNPGERNFITNNIGNGIEVNETRASQGNPVVIVGNEINQNNLLGIDHVRRLLSSNNSPEILRGPTSNGNDLEEDDVQNHPIITSVVKNSDSTTINGQLTSRRNRTYVLAFYGSDEADDSGFGEGQRFLGTHTVTIPNNLVTVNFSVTLNVSNVNFISATAHELVAVDSPIPFNHLGTSEFSPVFPEVPLADVQIKMNLAGDNFVGGNIRQKTPGDNQTKEMIVPQGFTGQYVVRIQNLHNVPKKFLVQLEADTGFAANIFGESTFTTNTLQPNAFQEIPLRVTPAADLPAGTVGNVIVKVLDEFGNSVADAVRARNLVNLIVTTNDDLEDSVNDDVIDSDPSTPGQQLSLRDAIKLANNAAGLQTITFDLPGSVKIATQSPLPTITSPVIIDGTTQGVGHVELVGQNNFNPEDGFVLAAGSNGSTISGFFIHSFFGDAIRIENSNNHTIGSNFLGLKPNDPNSVEGIQNLGHGVNINNGSNNKITKNVISGNLINGVNIVGANSKANEIIDNLIGTTINGLNALGNGGHGVFIVNGSDNLIRLNTISANGGDGVRIVGTQARNNFVFRNFIGIGNDGLANGSIMGNLGSGVFFGGSTSGNMAGAPENGNRINQNKRFGVEIDGQDTKDNIVSANLIGADELGAGPGNLLGGVLINDSSDNLIGGPGQDFGNLISGNGGLRPVEEGRAHGIKIIGTNALNNTILANRIGVSFNGLFQAANTGSGIHIEGAGQSNIGNGVFGDENVISGNLLHGIHIIGGGDHHVFGNLIGVGRDFKTIIPNGKNILGVVTPGGGNGVRIENSINNLIGTENPLHGNIIRGNANDGAHIQGELDFIISTSVQNVVQSNLIGNNDGHGVFVKDAVFTKIGAPTNQFGVGGNQILGNNGYGIVVESSDPTIEFRTVIQGNRIGAAIGENEPNILGGILLNRASHNLIGGGSGDILSGASLEGNLIGGNGTLEQAHSIELIDSSFNVIQGNFIGFESGGSIPAGNPNASGIFLQGTSADNVIGQTRNNGVLAGIGNLIGDHHQGIELVGEGAERNQIRGNAIGFGLESTPETGPGSNKIGIRIQDGSFNVIDANAIIGNSEAGIDISNRSPNTDRGQNVITRNQIGLSGSQVNAIHGIIIDGSSGNIIGGTELFDLRGDGPGSSLGNRIIGATENGILVIQSLRPAAENFIVGNLIGESVFGIQFDGNNVKHNTVFGNRIIANRDAGIAFLNGANNNLVGDPSILNPNQPGHNVVAQNGVGIQIGAPNNIGFLSTNFFGNGQDVQFLDTTDITPVPVIEDVFSSTEFEFTSIEGRIVEGANQEHLLQFFALNTLADGPGRLQFLGQRRFTPNGENGGRYRFVLNQAVNPTFSVVATSSLIANVGGVESFSTSPFTAPANIQLFVDDGDGIPDALEELLNPGSANDPAIVTIPVLPPNDPIADASQLKTLVLKTRSDGATFQEVAVLKTEVLGPLPPKVNIFAAMQLKQVNIAGVGRFEIEIPDQREKGLFVQKLLLRNPPVRDDGTLNFEVFRQDPDSPTNSIIVHLFLFDLFGTKVQIDVVDGGPGDRDGEVNGVIIDPVVFYTAPETDLTTSVITPATMFVGINSVLTVRTTNTGVDLADRVRSRLTLPPGFDFVSASDGGTFDPATRTVTFVLGDVDAGAVVDRTVTVRANNPVNGIFRSRVLPQGFIGDPNPDNDVAEVNVVVVDPRGDVTIVQTGKELRITGDGSANDITLVLNNGRVEVGSQNSNLNGSATPLVFTGITRLFVDLGAGNDSLTVTGSLGRTATVSFNGGTGTDRLVSNANVNQTLTDTRLVAAQTFTLAGFELASLRGGAGNNRLDASKFSGAVVLDGGAGNDTLIGGAGNDILIGGPGVDTVIQVVDADVELTNNLLTGRGNDLLDGIERVQLTGGRGNNLYRLLGFTGQATINGGAGRDILVADDDTDMVLTNALLTTAKGARVNLASIEAAELIGGASDNRLNASATSRPVVLRGLGGNDILTGGSGNDLLLGGDGDDTLVGGRGDDTLRGEGGNDRLDGGPGRNVLEGGEGQDGIVVNGTNGMDVIRIQRQANNMVRIEVNGQVTFSQYFGETIFVFGGAGNDYIQMLPGEGHAWKAEFHGGDGNDTLIGLSGDDVLDGGPGNNAIFIDDGVTPLPKPPKKQLGNDPTSMAFLEYLLRTSGRTAPWFWSMAGVA